MSGRAVFGHCGCVSVVHILWHARIHGSWPAVDLRNPARALPRWAVCEHCNARPLAGPLRQRRNNISSIRVARVCRHAQRWQCAFIAVNIHPLTVCRAAIQRRCASALAAHPRCLASSFVCQLYQNAAGRDSHDWGNTASTLSGILSITDHSIHAPR